MKLLTAWHTFGATPLLVQALEATLRGHVSRDPNPSPPDFFARRVIFQPDDTFSQPKPLQRHDHHRRHHPSHHLPPPPTQHAHTHTRTSPTCRALYGHSTEPGLVPRCPLLAGDRARLPNVKILHCTHRSSPWMAHVLGSAYHQATGQFMCCPGCRRRDPRGQARGRQ